MAKRATMTPLGSIKWDQSIYPRDKWEPSTIARYAEALDVGDVFPPIVIEDNPDDAEADGRLLDGKHRLDAHRKAGRTEIAAERHRVPEGMGAKFYAATLSARHGDRMSNADLKRLARECFDPEEGGDPTQNIAAWGRHLGLAKQTVFGWVGDIVNKGLEDRRAKGMRLARLGWTQAEIGALLDVDQSTVSDDMGKSESGLPHMREAMANGLPEAEAAKRWNLPVTLAHAVKLDGLDDKARLDKLDIKLTPYDVWNFAGCHDLMGDRHPGRIPGELACHALYFFTKPGDLIVDPMAGSGTMLDACLLMGRKARGYDIDHRHERVDIQPHDLTTGWPDATEKADLIFWDPPYFNKMDAGEIGPDGYIEGSVSGMEPDAYLQWIADRLSDCHKAARPGARLMFLMSDWEPDFAKEYQEHPGLFVWDYLDRLREAGWTMKRHIQCPLPSQGMSATNVVLFREQRRLGHFDRYLLVAEK